MFDHRKWTCCPGGGKENSGTVKRSSFLKRGRSGESLFTHPLSSAPSKTAPSVWGASCHGPSHELDCAAGRGCPEEQKSAVFSHRLDHCLWKCKAFSTAHNTCVMEPPCLVEEMSGGGSGMVSGLTAANRAPSCGRATIAGWAPCWNAERKARVITFTTIFFFYFN